MGSLSPSWGGVLIKRFNLSICSDVACYVGYVNFAEILLFVVKSYYAGCNLHRLLAKYRARASYTVLRLGLVVSRARVYSNRVRR